MYSLFPKMTSHSSFPPMQLRPYQEECLSAIAKAGNGKWLCVLATGLGKTVIISQIPRHGRMLLLAHRQELLTQPRKYFNCSYGVEMGDRHYKGEEVCAASIQSLSRRLRKFNPDDFELIVVDEAHHCASPSYKKVMQYFTGAKRVIGFTATPNRADGMGLESQFEKIIFNRDVRFGIEGGWLSPIECHRVKVDYDLSKLVTKMGDYSSSDLAKIINNGKYNGAVKELVTSGKVNFPCLIFACTVDHAHEIAKGLPNAKALDAESKDRTEVLEQYKNGEIDVLVNCALFTEGTDLPLVKSVIIARPTCSHSLYSQMVGRGLRLAERKDKCQIFDLVGVAENVPLCTAPSLIGIEEQAVPKSMRDDLVGDLLKDIPLVATKALYSPESWIGSMKVVELFSKRISVKTHKVAYILTADMRYVLDISCVRIEISAPDNLGYSTYLDSVGNSFTGTTQDCLDFAYQYLCKNCAINKTLWDLNIAKNTWGRHPVSEKQLAYIKQLCKKKGVELPFSVRKDLTKFTASQIIERLKNYA